MSLCQAPGHDMHFALNFMVSALCRVANEVIASSMQPVSLQVLDLRRCTQLKQLSEQAMPFLCSLTALILSR